ncbi:MAG: hypothetical protein GXP19_07025 [Gammaproteobacteria bacterium]|nr:hypothetical protein [Gammaproteobacteria bacterium]
MPIVHPLHSMAAWPAGQAREHDCMDAGGRVTQEQLPRSGSFDISRNSLAITRHVALP